MIPRAKRYRSGSASSSGEYAGYQLLSTLLNTMDQFDPLPIAPGTMVLIDLQMSDAQAIGQITNAGELRFDPRVPTRLVCQGIDNHDGWFRTDGDLSNAHPADWEIVLCGPKPTVNGWSPAERISIGTASGIPGGTIGTGLVHGLTHLGNVPTGNDGETNDSGGFSRGLINRGTGVLELHAAGPAIRRLNNHASTSDTVLTLDSPITAAAGAEILVTPSGFFNTSTRTQRRTIVNAVVNSTTITINTPLTFARWGKLQYATNQGPSLTADPFTDGRTNTYTGSSSGTTLTITAHTGTGVSLGERLQAVGTDGTISYIVSQLSGPTGGNGTYQLSHAQTFSSRSLTLTGMRRDVSQDPIIDERAFVLVMSSSGRIRARDIGNSDLALHRFGWHGMTMDHATTRISGIHGIDWGQQGLLGRYAWHFHKNAYTALGAIKTTGVAGNSAFSQTASPAGPNFAPGDAVVTGCAWDTGHNRGLLYHATRGIEYSNNIVYRSYGNAIMGEDGSEQECIHEGNVSVGVVSPRWTDLAYPGQPAGAYNTLALKEHEVNDPVLGTGSTGHWFSNFKNRNVNNWGVDIEAGGWWNGMPVLYLTTGASVGGCAGYSKPVPIYPNHEHFNTGYSDTWDGNSALSCMQGGRSNLNPYNDQGQMADHGPDPRDNDVGNSFPGSSVGQPGNLTASGAMAGNKVPADFSGIRFFKCGGDREPYHNRVFVGRYTNARVADNHGATFNGTAQNGSENNFGIGFGYTLNAETQTLRQFAASYHGLMKFKDSSYFNYSGLAPVRTDAITIQGSCVLASWDLYTDPLHVWTIPMSGWALYNSLGMWQTPGPATVNDTTTYDYISGHISEDVSPSQHYRWLLGCVYDHHGSLSQGPTTDGYPQGHIVFNQPFVTTGLTSIPNGTNTESRCTQTPMFSIQIQDGDMTLLHGATAPNSGWRAQTVARKWQRLDASWNPIAGATWEARNSYSQGDFTPPTGGWAAHPELWASLFWGNKHAMMPVGSRVRMTHPGYPAFGNYQGWFLHISSAYNSNAQTTDYIYHSFPILGSRTITGVVVGISSYNPVADAGALVAAAPSSHSYWFDTANNELWVKAVADYHRNDGIFGLPWFVDFNITSV